MHDEAHGLVPQNPCHNKGTTSARVPSLDALLADAIDGFFDPTAPLDFGDFDLNVLAEEAFHNPPAEPNFDAIVPVPPSGGDAAVPDLLHLPPLPPAIITTGSRTTVGSRSIAATERSAAKPPLIVPPPVITGATRGGTVGAPEAVVPSMTPVRRARPTNPELECVESRSDKLARYRAKKARRNATRGRVLYECRKRTADQKPRIRGRFVSVEEYAAWQESQQCKSEADGADIAHGGPLHTVPTAV